MADGFFVGIDINELPTYPGVLSNAIIPVVDATTGNKYKILASDVLVGGDYALFPFTAAGGPTETVTGLIGKTVIAIFRGNDFANGATWDSITATATAPDSNDWLGGESLNFLYKI